MIGTSGEAPGRSASTTPPISPTPRSCPTKTATAIGFLRRAVAFYRSHGIEVERLMADNGPAYVSVARRRSLGGRTSRKLAAFGPGRAA